MDSSKPSPRSSRYQDYLPAILQDNPVLEGFLLAFEKVLTGYNDNASLIINDDVSELSAIDPFPGLEEIIDKIHLFFDPQNTPEDFLPWLANWVALSLRDDWEVKAKKEFIEKAVYLYRLRGTNAGLTQILNLYLENSGFGKTAKIDDQFENFPYFFQVQLTLKDRDPEKYWKQAKIAQAIIDQEKPAHTYYALKILVPTMQLTTPSQVSYPFQPFSFSETQPLSFPETQKLEIVAVVEITEPSPLTESAIAAIIGKITVRFQDGISQFHLLTPETTIEENKITIKRQLNYQQFKETLDSWGVTIKSINNIEVGGKLTVTVKLNIDQTPSVHAILEQNFNLPAVLPQDTLKICYKDESKNFVIKDDQGTIFTVLGTQASPF